MNNNIILQFANSAGGVKCHVIALSANLDKKRYPVIGLFPFQQLAINCNMGDSYCCIFDQIDLSYEIIELPRRIRLIADIRALFQVMRMLRRYRPHILHCHSSMPGIIGRTAAIFYPPKAVIYTPHLIFYHRYTGIKRLLFYAMERLLATRTDAIIAVSHSEMKKLKQELPNTQVYCVNNGVTLPDIPDSNARESVLREFGLSENRRLILSPARLEPQKDVATLINAMARLRDKHPSAVALLAGDGKLRDELQALVRDHGLEDNVCFLGWRRDVHRLMAAADIVVLATNIEGCPYALLEASAMAKPVCGSDVQGVQDCIRHGKTGFLFPKHNAAALAGYLDRILSDPVLSAALGAAGRAYVGRHFSLRSMIKKTEKIYDKYMR